MTRKTIKIDADLCTGCGLCVSACKEGAIQLIDGKAKLVREDYCDGLGMCLPVCPTNAISFEEADTMNDKPQGESAMGGCPGTMAKVFAERPAREIQEPQVEVASAPVSQLRQWPVQIKLLAPNAQFLQGARLLIAADCTAFAYANFHQDYMKNKITLIGCPKLDEVDYAEKLTTILQQNDIQSVTIARMEVPCCAGIVEMTKRALENYGKLIPWQVVNFSIDGVVLEDT